MIELTTTLFIFLGAMNGGLSLPDSKVLAAQIATSTIEKPMTLEEYVREYFKDTPVLAEISKCESTFKQYDSNGNVIRGRVDPADVGVMQINERYHADTAKKLGYDLTTIEGNLAYAKYLYEKQGVDPWNASAKCWKKAVNSENHLAKK